MINLLVKFISTLEYNKKYKHMPDQFMYDELYKLAYIRNMDGLLCSRDRISSQYVSYRTSSDKLKIMFDTVWANVKESHKRKHWAYEVNKQMAKIQNGEK
jgi:hypothetical protein